MRFDARDEPTRGSWAPSEAELRRDDTDDVGWWAAPRLTPTADAAAHYALQLALRELFDTVRPDNTSAAAIEQPPLDVLLLGATHEAHLPNDVDMHVVGLGFNEEELCRNGDLAETHVALDLVAETFTALPFSEHTFDVVLLLYSAQYLARPISVFSEVLRVLRPGGFAVVACGGRVWQNKATSAWCNAPTDAVRALFFARCLYHSTSRDGSTFTDIAVEDQSPDAGRTDALFVVTARRGA